MDKHNYFHLKFAGIVSLFLLTISVTVSKAQNNVMVITNDTNYVPSTAAILDINDNSRGLLIPRMSHQQMLNISPVKDGLTVFVTDPEKFGYWYYDEYEDSEQIIAEGEWVKLKDEGHDPWPVTAPDKAVIMYSGPLYNFFMTGDTAGLGKPGTIMDGWCLCNGNNGTPDLTGRFVVGYKFEDAEYGTIGETNGFDSIQITDNQLPQHWHGGPTEDASCSHTHGITDYGHRHDINIVQSAIGDAERITSRNINNDGVLQTEMEKTGLDDETTSAEAELELSFPVNFLNEIGGNDEGQTKKICNRPRYYVLAFIMRIEP